LALTYTNIVYILSHSYRIAETARIPNPLLHCRITFQKSMSLFAIL